MWPFPERSPGPDNGPGELLRRWFRSLARSARPGSDGVARIEPRQVYILPTRFGLMYAVMLIAMLLGSNNYGSNPGFLLTFLLAGLGMAALFQTWKNLLRLEIAIRPGEPVFKGNRAKFIAGITNTQAQPRAGIRLRAADTREATGETVDLPARATVEAIFERKAARRGWLPAGRAQVESTFPLGLFRAWAYIESDVSCLVYPGPAERGDGIQSGGAVRDAASRQVAGDDDFAGHRPRQEGDAAMHVDWKALARGRGWHVKQFDSPRGDSLWLDWSMVRARGTEEKIAALTRAVLDLDHANATWGMSLPGIDIPPASGEGHRHLCLRALALLDPSGEQLEQAA